MNTHPLPLRAQAELLDRWLSQRLDTVLPRLMDRAGVDTWIVVAREYNEDPVFRALLPGSWLSARRRTILVFHRSSPGVQCLAVAPYPVGTAPAPAINAPTADCRQPHSAAGRGGPYTSVWDPSEESQWAALHRTVAERDPTRIGVNVSQTFALADGMSATEHRLTLEAMGEFADRVVPAEAVAIGLLETRLTEEIATAHELNALAHQVIAEAFSADVVKPGQATGLDVAWWIQQRFHDLGVPPWFLSTVDIQRCGTQLGDVPDEAVIEPGDLLHCDVGLTSVRLHTDTQQNAYVLRDGESGPPDGLVEALAVGNRMQDLTVAEFDRGGTGNDILLRARAAAAGAGIEADLYSHPVGLHGHAAGPTIGLWDNQVSVHGSGDYPVYDDTIYALELCTYSPVPEWGDQRVRMALEQGIAVTGGKVEYLDRRQTALHLIG
ncbi:MAG: M24 family metallopeptidase [Geodermatophilaceae bacterium]|nr:M24 family metallopeptidase [Geodermatophilaceae bacterium]